MRKFGTLTREQLGSKDTIKTVTDFYIAQGFSVGEAAKMYKDLVSSSTNVAETNEDVAESTGDVTEATKELTKEQKKAIKENERLREERAKLAKEERELLEDIAADLLKDGVDKELEIERIKWDRRIEQAKEKFGEESKVIEGLKSQREVALTKIEDSADKENEDRRKSIQQERDEVEIQRINDQFEQQRQQKVFAFEQEIADLDEAKDDENALLAEKKLLLQEELREIDLAEEEFQLEKKREQEEAEAVEQQLKLQNQLDIAQGASNLAGALSQLAEEGSTEAKALGSIQVIINGAVAITQALAQLGPIAGALAAAGIVATTAVQLQKINNLKDGVIDLKGPGTKTSDSIPANLSRGESVMTADETTQHRGILQAIRDKNLDDYLRQEYLPNMMLKQIKTAAPMQDKRAQDDRALNQLIKLNKKGIKISNPAAISKPMRDAIEEAEFLNNGGTWG